jgi:hypothetical protein
MPIAGVSAGKGPANILPGQTGLDMAIIGDISVMRLKKYISKDMNAYEVAYSFPINLGSIAFPNQSQNYVSNFLPVRRS